MSITVVKAGLADAFYDMGRFGYQHLGINPGGAMDTVAMQVANALVLNTGNQPVLEMHFPAATLQFNTNTLIALSGADFTATINNQPVPLHTPMAVAAQSILRFNQPRKGARVYLAVHGGFTITSWLGSYSTNLVCNAGGYNGRCLQTGDGVNIYPQPVLEGLLQNRPFVTLPFSANIASLYAVDAIQLLPGPQHALLASQSKNHLISGSFAITSSSNRMGYRLQGQPLHLKTHQTLLSSAVTRGTLQLLPNGQLIVLMADHQTTGGYPVIGYVTSASFSALAQYGAGTQLQFTITNIATAGAALDRQQLHLLQLQNACTFQLQPFLNNANC